MGESCALTKASRHELVESLGAVAHGVFALRLYLAKGLCKAGGLENRIVAKALDAAGWPHQGSINSEFLCADLPERFALIASTEWRRHTF